MESRGGGGQGIVGFKGWGFRVKEVVGSRSGGFLEWLDGV